MKYLTAIPLMLVLFLAIGAWQGAAKPNDSARNERATAQGAPVPTADRPMTADRADANDQKPPSQIRANYHGKLSLSLGSMPCPPNDQQCRQREKEKFPPQEDRP